jgi:uncharacterized protein YlxP (DUF503 family)
MTVGVCTVELEVSDSNSLKDKRQVLQSLLTRLRSKFNLSIAQLDTHGSWRNATLGIAHVSNDAQYTDRVLNKVLDTIEQETRVIVLGCELERL